MQSSDPVEVVPGLWTTGEVNRVTSFEGIAPPKLGTKRYFLVDGNLKIKPPLLFFTPLLFFLKLESLFLLTPHLAPINSC